MKFFALATVLMLAGCQHVQYVPYVPPNSQADSARYVNETLRPGLFPWLEHCRRSASATAYSTESRSGHQYQANQVCKDR